MVGRSSYSLILGLAVSLVAGLAGCDSASEDASPPAPPPPAFSIPVSAATVRADAPVLRDVVYTGSRFVAAGLGNTLLTSTDGAAWTAVKVGNLLDVRLVATGGGVTVGVAANGLARSTDGGATWTASASNLCGSAAGELIHDGTQFVALSQANPIGICTSTDGAAWSPVTQTGNVLAGNAPYAMAFDGTNYVVAMNGGVFVSSTLASGWTFYSATNSPSQPQEIIYDGTNAKFVVVDAGVNGILTKAQADIASAAVAWTLPTTVPTLAAPTGIAELNGTYVVVTQGGEAVVSTDGGAVWAAMTTGTTDALHAVVAATVGANPVFVAVGERQSILTSPATIGAAWTARNGGAGLGGLVNGIGANGAGQYIAVGALDSIGGGDGLVTSGDGIAWTDQPTAPKSGPVVYGGGQYLVAGYTALGMSSNGTAWTAMDPSVNFTAIHASGSKLAMTSGGRVIVTTDPEVIPLKAPLTAETFNAIAGDRAATETLVAVGTAGTIFRSTDGGTNWAPATYNGGITASITKVYYVPAALGRAAGWIALSSAGIITSADGDTWTLHGGPLVLATLAVPPVGDDRPLLGGTLAGVVWSSTDGITFTLVSSPTANGLAATNFRGMVFGNVRHLALQFNGLFYESIDGGSTWAAVSLTGDAVATPVSLLTDGTDFYAATANGAIHMLALSGALTYAVSTVTSADPFYGTPLLGFDGTSAVWAVWVNLVASGNAGNTAWSTYSRFVPSFADVAYNNGTIAVLGAGVMVSSDIGVNWTRYPLPGVSGMLYGQIVPFGASGFMVAGADMYGSGAVVFTSTNGITWTQQSIGAITSIEGLGADNGTYVLGTGSGKLYTSADGATWAEVALANLGTNVTGINATSMGEVEYKRICHDGTQFVALGTNRGAHTQTTLSVSATGASWQMYDMQLVGDIRTLACQNGTAYIGGDGGLIATHASTYP